MMFFRRITPRLWLAVGALLAMIAAVSWLLPGPPAAVAASFNDGPGGMLAGMEPGPEQAGTVGNPGNLTANGSGAGQVTLTWTAATNATKYWVYSVKSDGSGEAWTDAGSGTSFVITGLTPSTDYWFNVVATSGAGAAMVWSQFSGWASTRTWATAQPPPPSRYTAISAGEYHTCGIEMDGSVDCFGSDGREQSSPPDGKFISVSAGSEHTCGVKEDGTAVCWGNSAVGNPSAELKFVHVASGDLHACGLTAHPGGTVDHKIVCWGASSGSGRTNDQSRSQEILAVSAGADHNCEVYRYYHSHWSGSGWRVQVRCWGNDSADQLADFWNMNTGFVETVAAGGAHTCWRHGDGAVGCQGDNTYDQRTVPAATSEDADESAYVFTTITAGKNHTCAIDGANGNAAQALGSVRCWGSNLQGQSQPPADSDFIAVTGGAYHTCGLKSDGTVRCWGDNSYGQAPGVR